MTVGNSLWGWGGEGEGEGGLSCVRSRSFRRSSRTAEGKNCVRGVQEWSSSVVHCLNWMERDLEE